MKERKELPKQDVPLFIRFPLYFSHLTEGNEEPLDESARL